MRHILKTVPTIHCGGGLSLLCLLIFILSCADTPVEEPLDPQVLTPLAVEEMIAEVEEPTFFAGDPFAEDPIDEVSLAEVLALQEPEPLPGPELDAGQDEQPPVDAADSIVFTGDPFAEAEARVIAADTGNVITKEYLWDGERPESQLVELENLPEAGYDDALLEKAAALGLAQLRARYLTDVLEGDAMVMVPEGIRTFGETLPVRFRLRNPLGDPVELIPSASGYILELDWTVERWLPIGSHDRVQRHRFFRVGQQITLRPDQEFIEYTELPLVVAGDQGSVWMVQVDARLRFSGAAFEGRLLPVHEIDFQAARFLVLPPGWEGLNDNPYSNLKRVLLMSSEEVDRHVLVCVALLKGQERQDAVQLLLDGLRKAPTPGRVLTITQSLQWLTGEHAGSMPGDWFRWEARRKSGSGR